MGFTEFIVAKQDSVINDLRINLTDKGVAGSLSGVSFIDKDTKQHITYIPALELSGYGETEEKAEEMIKFSIDNLFQFLVNLSAKNLQIEMETLGWKKGLFNKHFSKSFVDINGALQNFNVEANSVNKITLIAA